MLLKNIPLLSALFLCSFSLHAKPVKIVSAENFYGGVAQQIAGSSAEVTSILSNPNQDPHEFQSDAKTAKKVADATIIIYNGLGYDTWMEKLLGADKKSDRVIINVAQLVGAKEGSNPHLWYDPKTMPALAAKLASILHRPQSEITFAESMQPLIDKIKQLKPKTSGMKVTATEPVFEYMASALGFQMLNKGYQHAIMNDATPRFQEIASFEKSLTDHTAQLLFQNSQTINPSTQRMIAIAKQNHIPVINITETEPTNTKNYVDWMILQLEEIEASLPAH
ncbi:MAG: zinc ABC transporter substrate-binding protein [Chthoniobacterales bacterium]|nr:zinc ABC transporter substrate-binding protein [Chthoniobacterales bacterium]